MYEVVVFFCYNCQCMCAYRRVQFSAYAEKKISDVPCALIFYSASVTYKYSSSALNPFKATLNHPPSMRSRFHSFLISHPYQMFLTALYVIRLVFYILRCRCSHCPPAVSLSLFLCFNFFVVERQYTANPHCMCIIPFISYLIYVFREIL